jgi:hypothetical protein
VAQRALDLILIKDPDLLPLVNARWLHGGFDVRLDGARGGVPERAVQEPVTIADRARREATDL